MKYVIIVINNTVAEIVKIEVYDLNGKTVRDGTYQSACLVECAINNRLYVNNIKDSNTEYASLPLSECIILKTY